MPIESSSERDARGAVGTQTVAEFAQGGEIAAGIVRIAFQAAMHISPRTATLR